MVAAQKAAGALARSHLQALPAVRQVEVSRKDFNALRLDTPIDPSEIVVRLNRDKKRVAVRVRWVLRKTADHIFLTNHIPPNVALDALSRMIPSWDEEH
jgi:hypothetical protein